MHDSSSPHGAGPICPNCTQARNLKVRMKGPGPDPAEKEKSSDLFFVCERCGTTMRDRRKRPREAPPRW